MKNILIVDDSAEVRVNLIKLLETVKGIKIIGEAEDYFSAIDNFKKFNPDIVILDIDLPNINGIEILSEIKKLNQSATVIMFTNFTNRVMKKLAVKKGADFFLDKSNDIDKLEQLLIELADH